MRVRIVIDVETDDCSYVGEDKYKSDTVDSFLTVLDNTAPFMFDNVMVTSEVVEQ
jgi:hypothetical protein